MQRVFNGDWLEVEGEKDKNEQKLNALSNVWKYSNLCLTLQATWFALPNGETPDYEGKCTAALQYHMGGQKHFSGILVQQAL